MRHEVQRLANLIKRVADAHGVSCDKVRFTTHVEPGMKGPLVFVASSLDKAKIKAAMQIACGREL